MGGLPGGSPEGSCLWVSPNLVGRCDQTYWSGEEVPGVTIGWGCLGAPEPVQGRGLVDEITAVPRPGADTAPRPAWGLGLGPRRDLPALSFCAALCRRGSPCLCSGGRRGNHVPLFPGSVTSGKGYPPPLTTLAFPSVK